MITKEIADFISLLSKLNETQQREFYYMIKGAAIVAGK